jgi:hypothetical protein
MLYILHKKAKKVAKMAEIEEADETAQRRKERLQARYPELSDEYQIYLLGQAEGIRAAQGRGRRNEELKVKK